MLLNQVVPLVYMTSSFILANIHKNRCQIGLNNRISSN